MLLNRYGSKRLWYVTCAEGLFIFLMLLASASIRMAIETGDFGPSPEYLKSAVLTGIYMLSFYYFDLFTPEMFQPSRHMFNKLVQAIAVALIVQFSLFYFVPSMRVWRGVLFMSVLILPPAIVLFRFVLSKILSIELPGKRVLIIGSGELAKKIGQDIYGRPDQGLKLVGFVDDDPAKFGVSIVNPGVIGGYGDILQITRTEDIDMIIVALQDRRSKLPISALLDCKLRGISVEEGETFKERQSGKIPLDHLKPSWMVFSDGFKSLRSRKLVKRFLDVVVSSICLVVSLPIMAVVAALIRLESRGPVIFKQVRVGENGKEFNIYKFRSMRNDAESETGPVWAVTQDNRVTRIGNIIRLLRIDELPQLINVIKGDMSFVGPRPERPFFVEKLRQTIPYYGIRTMVKPGLTGWAQIKYPYGASVEDALEKLQYDIYYIKNMSPLLDIIIFVMTVKVVLTRQGAR